MQAVISPTAMLVAHCPSAGEQVETSGISVATEYMWSRVTG